MLDKKYRFKLDVLIAKQQHLVLLQKQVATKQAADAQGKQTRQLLDNIIRKNGRSHAS